MMIIMNSINKGVPSVILTGKYVDDAIVEWLNVDICDVKEYMELILSKLGFNSDDKINVYKYTQDGYLCFKVNDLEYKINIGNKISNGQYPVMFFDKDKIQFGYQLILNNNIYGNDIKLNMFKYSMVIDNVYFTYELSNEWIEYTVKNGEDVFEFRVSKPNNLVSQNRIYKGYELFNQEELIKYLVSLEFTESIFDIYKKVCELSLGSDVSKYSYIDLRLMKWVYDEEVLVNKTTDLIYLEDGQLVSLIVTKDDKQVWYDKCDSNSSWVYDTDKSQVTFSMCKVDSVMSFNSQVRPKGDGLDYTDELAYEDMKTGKIQVNNVKKLVKELFPRMNNR